MNKKYQVIYADPPWPIKFGVDNHRERRASTGSPKGTWTRPNMNYNTMPLDKIRELPVKDLASDDSQLYLWVVNKYIEEGYRVARAWGFRPVCLLTWAKTPRGLGLGGTFVQTTEHILFCRKGRNVSKRRLPTTWWNWTRPENGTGPKHSRKPEEAQTVIESITDGPRLEMFARRKRMGWDVWGNEVESDIEL